MAQKQNKQLKYNPVLKDFDTLINKITQEKIELEKALEDKTKQLELVKIAKTNFEKEDE